MIKGRSVVTSLGALIALAVISLPELSSTFFAGDERASEAAVNSQHVYEGECLRVVDGDSLYLQGVKEQIRLWGVDAPERDERGYNSATESLRNKALGQSLRCELVDKDKYQRIVARCSRRSDQLDINRAQIELSSVNEYCRFSQNYYGHCKKH